MVISLTAFMVWFSCIANAEEFYTITFDESMSSEVSIQVYTGLESLETINASIRQHRDYGYNVDIKTSINGVSDQTISLTGGGDWATNFGTLNFSPQLDYCEGSTTHNCDRFSFTPNTTAITSQPTNNVIKVSLVFFHRRNGVVQFTKTANIYFNRVDINMGWRSSSTGTETNRSNNFDIFKWHYANLKGYFANESEIKFELWIKDGAEETEKIPITKSEAYSSWSGTEWFINSAYGEWFVQSFSACSSTTDGSMCSQALFRPNRTTLNRVYGRNVTMWLRWTKTVANQNQTEILQFDLIGHPQTTFEWMTEGAGNLEARTQLEFEDVPGTGTIFKNKSSSITVDVSEKVTQNAPSVDGLVGSAEMVGDYLTTEFGTNFKYGTWFVESVHTTEEDPHSNLYHTANLRFVFRPNSDEINQALNGGETATSTLKLNIHQGNNTTPVVQSNEITITIFRQTVKPILTFTSSDYRVPESNSNVEIVVNLNETTNANVTFSYEIIAGTAIATEDYTVPNNLTGEIESGSTNDTISIPIISDEAAEGNETFTVRFTNLSGAVFTNGATTFDVIVTIEDNDAPELTLTTTNFRLPEENDGGEFTIDLELASTVDVKVTFDITLSGGTATNGLDYKNPVSLRREIAIGSTTDSITIPIISDTLNEGNETFNFTISNLVGAILENNASTLVQEITIIDNEIPTVRFMQDNFRVDENVDNRKVEVAVNLSGSTNESVVIAYETENGSAIAGTDFAGVANSVRAIITIEPGETTGTISIGVNNDSDIEGIEEFKIKLYQTRNAVFGENTTELNATVSIIDDDAPIITITGTTLNVVEGATASFRLSASPNSGISESRPLQVKYYAEQRGNFMLWRASRIHPMKTNQSTLTIKTFNDEIEENPGTIIVTLVNTENYISFEGSNSAIISITDNDAERVEPQPKISVTSVVANAIVGILNNIPASVESETPSPIKSNIPTVSIDASHSQVNEGSLVEFTITTSGGLENSATQVRLNLNPVGDFFDFSESKQISRRIQGNKSVHLVFPTIDDTLAEADGRLEVAIVPDSTYKIASNKTSTSVIVSDAVDRQVRQGLLTASSQAFLPDVLGNMTARTSALISQRVQQGFNESNNVSLNLGGQESVKGLIEMSGEMTNQGYVSWRELFGDSSFALTLFPGDDFVAPTTFWGVGDNRNLSSTNNLHAWSGDVFTGQFGVDALINQELLTGLSASITENEIEVGRKNAENLEFALNSTTITPYLGWTSPTQNAELRAIVGYGVGEFTIDHANYDLEILPSRSYLFAFSGRKELYSSDRILNGKTKLNIFGDSWLARHYVEGQDDVLGDLQTDAHYLRIKTEGVHQFSFVRGSSLTPLIAVGIRDDRKDQLTNFGIEFTGGFDFIDPIGLTLSGNGSMLYTGESSIQKISMTGSLGYDYGNDALGFTFGVSPTWGQTQASVQKTLWSSSILASDQEIGQYSDGTQVNSEIGYGFILGEDSRKLNLYSRYEFDAVSNDQLSLGTSVSIGSNLSFDLEGTRAINTQESEATKYQLNARLSW